MKAFLVVAAVVGLVSPALADCPGHKVTASTKVDKEITTASVIKPSAASRSDREDETASEAKEQPGAAQN